MFNLFGSTRTMRYLLIVLLVFCAFPALAQESTAERSQRVNAELNRKIANMTDDEKAAALTRLEEKGAAQITSEWIDVGEKLGKGLSATAREMGVEVNAFSQTPVGKLAVFLLVWNFFGSDLAKLSITGIGLFVFLPTLLFMMRKAVIRYTNEGKVAKWDFDELDSGVGFIFLVFGFATLATIIIPLFTVG